jgi:serine phosphatase RsbU (regulator of sigma subunit)
MVTETLKDYRNKTFVRGNFGVDGALIVVSAEDAAEIAVRAAIEGGTGVYGFTIESSEITTEADAQAVAELDVQKYAFAPVDLQFSSYTTDWVPGTRLKVKLPALGIAADTYFLIDEVHVVRVDNDILKATIRATKRRVAADFSTQRTQSGNDYFVELVREAKRKGTGISDGAGGGVIGSAVKSYYDTNVAAVNVTTAETLIAEKTFTMSVASNIFIAFSVNEL